MIELLPQQSIDLATLGSTPHHLRVGLGWHVAQKPTHWWQSLMGKTSPVDLDAACVMLDRTGGLIDLIWFGNLRAKDDSVRHQGDRSTGRPVLPSYDPEHLLDHEVIDVFLDQIAPSVDRLCFVVCSYHGHTFKDIDHAHCRILDPRREHEWVRIALTKQGDHTGLLMATLSRDRSSPDRWFLQAIGQPIDARTPDILAKHLADWMVADPAL